MGKNDGTLTKIADFSADFVQQRIKKVFHEQNHGV